MFNLILMIVREMLVPMDFCYSEPRNTIPFFLVLKFVVYKFRDSVYGVGYN